MPLSSLRLFTSESVTEGHPDKVCDRISDSILDAILAQDPAAHVAVETMATTGLVHVAGEVTTNAYVEIPEIVRSEIVSIGYTSSEVCFDGASCGVSISIGQQSPEWTRLLRCEEIPGTSILSTSRARGIRASCSVTPVRTRLSSCRCRSTWRIVSPSV